MPQASRPSAVFKHVKPDGDLDRGDERGSSGRAPPTQLASDERRKGLLLMKRLVSEVEIVAEAERTTVRLHWIFKEDKATAEG